MKFPILLLFLHHTHALFITTPLPTPSISALPGSSLHVSSTTSTIVLPPPSLSQSNSISTISPSPSTTTSRAEATITPKPSFKPGDEVDLMTLHQKWHIETYWSCATFGKDRVFCGWHEPVRPGGDEIAAANPGLDLDVRTKVAALGAAALAVAFAALL
ncbi:hypothetical protein VTL71DRAFT_12459 [Oculimacula yallundae]|uniref:Uncharacterized protein n=1 Tax=Oculimacula yallundae TaxID=86028 RepID=A0ABR4CQ97_9HELO